MLSQLRRGHSPIFGRLFSSRTCATLCVLGLLACAPNPYPGEKGKILHASLRLLPKSFDPPHIEDEGSSKTAAHVYDGLLQYHPFARPYKLIPALAESQPEVSDDKLTYTFRIKKGVRFVDDECFEGGRGREVTAHDFEWCLRRFAHPDIGAKGWWLFRDRVLGLDEWRDGIKKDLEARRKAGDKIDKLALWGLDRPIVGRFKNEKGEFVGVEQVGIEAVDKYTLRFRLKEVYPQFLWILAMPYCSVYPKEAVAHYGAEFRNHPVGTGPFKVVEYNPVYRVVYEKNESFREERVPDPRNNPAERLPGWDWEADEKAGLLVHAGKRIPLVDGMETRFILEDQPRWLYFKAGYTDFLNPPKENTDEALPGGELSKEMKDRGVRLDPWPELGTVYFAFNTKDRVVGKVKVRRAMALAIDHSWTVANLYGGQAVVATSMIPPGVAGHDPNYHPYHRKDGKAQIEKAKAMLAEAGYPGGIDPETQRSLRLRFENSNPSATGQQFAARFVYEMRQLGIAVDVINNTFPQMIGKMREGNYQVSSLAWGLDYPDAQNILNNVYGKNIAPEGNNYSRFVNAEFDRLYEAAMKLEEGPERTKLYERAAHIVSDEVPWITRTHRIRQNLQQPWLTGFKYTEVSYQFWRWCGVDADKRKELLAAWNAPTLWPIAILLLAFFFVAGKTFYGARR